MCSGVSGGENQVLEKQNLSCGETKLVVGALVRTRGGSFSLATAREPRWKKRPNGRPALWSLELAAYF